MSDFCHNKYSSILSDFAAISDLAKVVIASNFLFYHFFYISTQSNELKS